jgi:hypothetical protein
MRPEYKEVLDTVRKLTTVGAQPVDIANYLQLQGLTIDDFATLVEGPTVLGQAKEAFKGLIPGAVGLVETAGVGAASILPESMEESVRGTIQETAAKLRKPFAAAPGYEDTIPRKLSEAVGSTLPFLAAGPFGLAGRAAAVGLGTAAGAGEARLRAEEEGATAEQRASATGLGIIPGAFEAFAPLRILGRLGDDVVEGGVAYVKRALIAGGEEAAQEAASGFAQNLIAQGVYKPEQELIEGLGEQAAYGGATGAIIQGLLDLAIGRRAPVAKPTTPAAPAAAPVSRHSLLHLLGYLLRQSNYLYLHLKKPRWLSLSHPRKARPYKTSRLHKPSLCVWTSGLKRAYRLRHGCVLMSYGISLTGSSGKLSG